ncbi:MAG: hypothetical protein EPO19_07075 [Betaproteobacteria bacterium]|nr:MAG: hypothetical protein EPO19_07075 [Betaproteobacteria bacterium]
MNIDDIWSNYSERMAEIELFQRTAKDAAKDELKVLLDYGKRMEELPEYKDMALSTHNMTFRDARFGQLRSYHHKSLSVEDCQQEVIFRKNRQYQWLLAEAYEEFEDYVHKLYAYCGFNDVDFWPLSDYGSIRLSERNSLGFNWYIGQSHKKKGAPRSILVRFRQSFPLLQRHEVKNALGVNLALAIILVEELRHIVVHNGGKVKSKEAFIELVAKGAGFLNNGNVALENRELIEQFFGADKYENLIALLEIRVRPEWPIERYVCRFGILVNYLMSYGFLLYEVVKVHVKPAQA